MTSVLDRDYNALLDGAFFGTTFPHLMLMTYSQFKPPSVPSKYIPRIFGFRVYDGRFDKELEDAQRAAVAAAPPVT